MNCSTYQYTIYEIRYTEYSIRNTAHGNTGGLCNGSTAAFGAACRGSNPCPPTKFGEAEFGPEEHYEMREGEHFISDEGPKINFRRSRIWS